MAGTTEMSREFLEKNGTLHTPVRNTMNPQP
ncbi:MAG: hypothetical protein BWX84_00927 [Verrucomicrobia bacterium ADurb.Bin118]|nr:MAG: hypothetical protein BWX84_00927 [Verrucomicrobia bacterium ADurb.Bin118]